MAAIRIAVVRVLEVEATDEHEMPFLFCGPMLLGVLPCFLRRWRPVDPVIEESAERLKTYALDSGVSVQIEDSSPNCMAKIDRSRLGQAFINLLSNAIKFSPPEGEVLVCTKVEHGLVRILVTDQGPGIPDNFRGRIFQKFAQADSSDTRGKRGTGLGLAITKEIMTQMGGDVGFESREGRGSTFWLGLPLEQVKA